MVCTCSFVCSERERVVCLLQERHKHRQRCFLVKWSSASRTQNSCRLCIKHLHFYFFPSMLCNGWSLYLLATYGLHLNTHLLKLVASSNCVFGVGKKKAGWTHIWQRSGVGEFSEPKSLLPRPPHSSRSRFSIPWFWLWKWQACVFFFSLLQCWCFLSSPSLPAAICFTVFSQSSTHDDLYSFSLWICKSLYMHKKLWPHKSII